MRRQCGSKERGTRLIAPYSARDFGGNLRLRKNAEPLLDQHDSRQPAAMNSEPGVYALLMNLRAETHIRIGALGDQVFASGWYVYIGSAHGPGGVKSRATRHASRNKRQHWHIDYLTEVAEIREIWFSYAEQAREHDWARVLGELEGGRLPVVGFGSQDCKARCGSHLVHFIDRPCVATFQYELFRRYPDHPPVFVELVAGATK